MVSGSAAVAAATGGGACGSAAAAAPPVVFAHAEHLRALAGLFFWLLENWPGGLSVSHAAHRMA